jgi:hypothetical protein
MGKRGPMSFAKRQREASKKQAQDAKRARRAERTAAGPSAPDIIIHGPVPEDDTPKGP